MREHETHVRSIVKSITFRLIATAVTIILVLIFTGEIILAMQVGILEAVSKLILYYAHERIWGHITWGTPISDRE